MALDDFLRGLLGCATPADAEGVANKGYVDAAISAAVAGLGGGSGAGIIGITPTAVTHSIAGALALNLASGANYVFNVTMSQNVTGLSMTNLPSGFSLVFMRVTNSSGSTKTIDFTSVPGIVLDDELAGVVSVAAGAAFAGSFQVWNV